jgi:hypothetical protein
LPYIIHCHGPTNLASGEAKEVLSLQMLKDHDREMSFSYTQIFLLQKTSQLLGKPGQT